MTTTTQPNAAAMARIGALMYRLGTYQLDVEVTPSGLRVRNPHVRGCCDDNGHPTDTVTCKPRTDDAGRLWFFTSWGEPIAEATDLVGASVTIAATLRATGTYLA